MASDLKSDLVMTAFQRGPNLKLMGNPAVGPLVQFWLDGDHMFKKCQTRNRVSLVQVNPPLLQILVRIFSLLVATQRTTDSRCQLPPVRRRAASSATKRQKQCI